jgi:hypothetical protein
MQVAAEKLPEKCASNLGRACAMLLSRDAIDPEMRKKVQAIQAKLGKDEKPPK